MDWFLDVIKNKYAKFDGRARRKEYWMFQLFYYLIMAVVFLVFGMLTAVTGSEVFMTIALGIYFLFVLALLLPMLAVTVRRLHDIGKSGWWILISFVPYIGPIVLLVFCCLDSESGANKYGPNPKGVGA
ncbi:Inner membrane protein YhaI [Psychrobacter pasteurii]|uniref:Inner membrane protein YhaI n=1 Tax=Psychrobacter pasteurii TaxID=1945520 RepID=A0A1R4EHY2_9GAMM|nr:DUF805 domain-containing protein [Psychrobacter pasteurii]SJM38125.1 Inner membrane protein YhaI [Psychrobacter pasteurii]